jgi:hypothetical protein
MIKKLINNLKNRLKPSVSRQIRKDQPKSDFLENVYIKEARRKVLNVSKKNSKNFVTLNRQKIEDYLKMRNISKNKISYTHTHLYDPTKQDFPSFLDFAISFSERQSYQHIFVLDRKKTVGKISCKFERNNSDLQKRIISNINQIKRELYSELKRASQILSLEKYEKLNREYNNYFYLGINFLLTEEILNWEKRNRHKSTIDFFKELGINIKVTPSKNYTYDYKQLKFIKK